MTVKNKKKRCIDVGCWKYIQFGDTCYCYWEDEDAGICYQANEEEPEVYVTVKQKIRIR